MRVGTIANNPAVLPGTVGVKALDRGPRRDVRFDRLLVRRPRNDVLFGGLFVFLGVVLHVLIVRFVKRNKKSGKNSF